MTRGQITYLLQQAQKALLDCPDTGEMRAAGIPAPAVAKVEQAYDALDLALNLIDEASRQEQTHEPREWSSLP
jgi:hypothetical protein